MFVRAVGGGTNHLRHRSGLGVTTAGGGGTLAVFNYHKMLILMISSAPSTESSNSSNVDCEHLLLSLC